MYYVRLLTWSPPKIRTLWFQEPSGGSRSSWPVFRCEGDFSFFLKGMGNVCLQVPCCCERFWITGTSVTQGVGKGRFMVWGCEGHKTHVSSQHPRIIFPCLGGRVRENSRWAFPGGRERHGRLLFNLADLPLRNQAWSAGLKNLVIRLGAVGGCDTWKQSGCPGCQLWEPDTALLLLFLLILPRALCSAPLPTPSPTWTSFCTRDLHTRSLFLLCRQSPHLVWKEMSSGGFPLFFFFFKKN